MAELERQATTKNDVYMNHLSIKDSKEYIGNSSAEMNVMEAPATTG